MTNTDINIILKKSKEALYKRLLNKCESLKWKEDPQDSLQFQMATIARNEALDELIKELTK